MAASVSVVDGGPSVGILALNRWQNANGVDFVAVAGDADGSENLLVPLGQEVAYAGARVVFTRVHRPRRMKASLGMVPQLLRRVPTVHCVHVHGYYLFSTLAACLIARLYKVPYVVQLHGVFEPYHRLDAVAVKAAFDIIGLPLLRGAAAVICASESEKLAAADRLPGERLVVVPLAAHLPEASSSPAWAIDVPGSVPVVLFLGRLTAKKRLDVLLEAWPLVREQVPTALLVVAGPDELGLFPPGSSRPGVLYVGTVTGGDKTWLLRRADVFTLASESENFGIAVAEALAAGTPVVVSRQVATSELVQRTSSGIIIERPEPAALSNALIRLLLEPDLRAISAAGALHAAREISWDTAGGRFQRLYRDVASLP